MKTTQLFIILMFTLPASTFAEDSLPSPFLNESVATPNSLFQKIRFTEKRKNKVVTLAEVELSQANGQVKAVFDSEHLTPGHYQLVLATSCQSKKAETWVIGHFKTKSGFISTEMAATPKSDQWSLDNENLKPHLMIKRVDNKKSRTTTVSCKEINRPNTTSETVAAEEL